ncbi:MAG: hypothetical protein R3211_07390 [Balneolaceae bacterium]|nr:hypothetical protein [Balneolaceae bacterium]
MSQSELSEQNFKRISLINWLLSPPLLILFSWPYLYLSNILEISRLFAYPGSLFFGFPFMITLLHGHVTMALGPVHRQIYYRWLEEHPYTFGLMFFPIVTRTRFRLVLLGLSLLLLSVAWLVN